MAIAQIKTKYQVTIPLSVRKQVDVGVGDILEAKVEEGKIVFTPQSLLDKRLAEALNEIKLGRVSGSFDDADKAIKYLKKSVKRYQNDR